MDINIVQFYDSSLMHNYYTYREEKTKPMKFHIRQLNVKVYDSIRAFYYFTWNSGWKRLTIFSCVNYVNHKMFHASILFFLSKWLARNNFKYRMHLHNIFRIKVFDIYFYCNETTEMFWPIRYKGPWKTIRLLMTVL